MAFPKNLKGFGSSIKKTSCISSVQVSLITEETVYSWNCTLSDNRFHCTKWHSTVWSDTYVWFSTHTVHRGTSRSFTRET